MEQSSSETSAPQLPSRRVALKTGVSVAAATTVWSQPSVKGLARRPAYAAGSSGAVTFTINVVRLTDSGGDTPVVTITAPTGEELQITKNAADRTFTVIGGGTISSVGNLVFTSPVGGIMNVSFTDEISPHTFDAGLSHPNTTIVGSVTCI